MRLLPASPFAALAALALAAASPAVAQPPAKPATTAKPAAPAQAPARQLAPGQVAVQVECLGMPDGTLKNCKALQSQPKNPDAEQAAVQLAQQQKGTPPAGWPAAGKTLVLPLVLTPQKPTG